MKAAQAQADAQNKSLSSPYGRAYARNSARPALELLTPSSQVVHPKPAVSPRSTANRGPVFQSKKVQPD
jgi:hypothetical protein